ncbi:MAG: DUF3794 domain-containing protein [Clostridia bacterium]|nr:DUF3794 domain-containing protein [Clostridia bacterium]
MSLELIKEGIRVNEVLTKGSGQTVLENDIIVPDAKPDIAKILLFDADAIVNSTEVASDKLIVSGTANYKILYLSDEQDKTVKSINTKLNFSHTINMPSMAENGKCKARSEVEHIEYNILNGRKVNAKLIIKTDYKVTSEKDQAVANDIKGNENVQILKKSVNINSFVGAGQGEYKLSESLVIPNGKPAVSELLRSDIRITAKEYRLTDNKVIAKGELSIATLYIADDETRSIQFMEHEIPFTQFVDLNGVNDDALCDVDYRIIDSEFEASEDDDGELRVISADIILMIDVEGYERKTVDVLDDAYSQRSDILLDKETIVMEEAVTESRSQIVLKDTMIIDEHSPEIAEVFNVLCKPSLSEYRIADDKLVVEGSVKNSVLYLSNNNEQPVCCYQQEIPFRQFIDVKGAMPGMSCEITMDIDHCNYSMVSSNEVEIRLGIGANLKIAKQIRVPLVTNVTEKQLDENKFLSQPSVTIYFCQPGDTLWKVAKKYYTTAESIKKVNNLGDKDALCIGQQIIIPRKL